MYLIATQAAAGLLTVAVLYLATGGLAIPAASGIFSTIGTTALAEFCHGII